MLAWCRLARDVARKDLLLFRADLRGAFLAFLIPVALATLFGFIFRNGGRGQVEKVTMALVVEDDSPLATEVVRALHSNPNLTVTEMPVAEAESAVLGQRVAVVVTLPEGLGGGAPGQRPRMRHASGSLYEGNWAAGIVTETILRRMHDYVHYICPQFSETDINFQRVPTVDTSNPFIARWIPTADESMVVIRFANPKGIDFPYLLSMLHDSFMTRPNTIVVPAASAALKLARLARMFSVGGFCPLTQPSKYTA